MNHDLDESDELSAMTIILPVRMKRALRAFAVRHSCSASEAARTAIANHLQKHDNSTPRKAQQ